MKIIKNDKLIQRNSKIGKYTNFAGLALLLFSLYLSFTSMQKEVTSGQFTLLLVVMLLALVLTQVSIYFGNRWGRSPRPDEALDASLKGLPGDYTIYHFSSPVPHLLIGPAGAWVLLPYHQRGTVTYKNNRFRASGGGFAQGYMRIFGQENLGRPELDAEAETTSLKRFFARQMEDDEIPPIQAALVFLNDNIELQTDDAPLPVLQVKKLKDFIRRQAKESPLPANAIEQAKSLLDQ
ncbi:MAG: hypothetical protein AB1564_03815 [Chloroflexota bacterium]